MQSSGARKSMQAATALHRCRNSREVHMTFCANDPGVTATKSNRRDMWRVPVPVWQDVSRHRFVDFVICLRTTDNSLRRYGTYWRRPPQPSVACAASHAFLTRCESYFLFSITNPFPPTSTMRKGTPRCRHRATPQSLSLPNSVLSSALDLC